MIYHLPVWVVDWTRPMMMMIEGACGRYNDDDKEFDRKAWVVQMWLILFKRTKSFEIVSFCATIQKLINFWNKNVWKGHFTYHY